MLSKRRLAAGGLSALFFVTGCTTSGSLLVVDLRTDLVSEVEFDAVRLELLDDDASGSFERHDAMAGADYVAGVRIGELLVEGSQAYLRVALLRHGVTVAERPVLVSMHGATAVTVVIGRDCRGVSCPGSADDPSQTACLAGHCVDPSCVEEAPQTCEPECSADADCPAPAAACAHAVCTAGGACLFGEIDGACGADAYCVPTIGCVSRPAPDSGGDCDANGNCVCPPNAVCDLSCTSASCSVSCEAGSTCNVSCPSGQCDLQCDAGATCNFDCAGGDCGVVCDSGSHCATDCSELSCSILCLDGADCGATCGAGASGTCAMQTCGFTLCPTTCGGGACSRNFVG